MKRMRKEIFYIYALFLGQECSDAFICNLMRFIIILNFLIQIHHVVSSTANRSGTKVPTFLIFIILEDLIISMTKTIGSIKAMHQRKTMMVTISMLNQTTMLLTLPKLVKSLSKMKKGLDCKVQTKLEGLFNLGSCSQKIMILRNTKEETQA